MSVSNADFTELSLLAYVFVIELVFNAGLVVLHFHVLAYHLSLPIQFQMTHYLIPAFHCHLFLSLRCVNRLPWFVLGIVLDNSECSHISPDRSVYAVFPLCPWDRLKSKWYSENEKEGEVNKLGKNENVELTKNTSNTLRAETTF